MTSGRGLAWMWEGWGTNYIILMSVRCDRYMSSGATQIKIIWRGCVLTGSGSGSGSGYYHR